MRLPSGALAFDPYTESQDGRRIVRVSCDRHPPDTGAECTCAPRSAVRLVSTALDTPEHADRLRWADMSGDAQYAAHMRDVPSDAEAIECQCAHYLACKLATYARALAMGIGDDWAGLVTAASRFAAPRRPTLQLSRAKTTIDGRGASHRPSQARKAATARKAGLGSPGGTGGQLERQHRRSDAADLAQLESMALERASATGERRKWLRGRIRAMCHAMEVDHKPYM